MENNVTELFKAFHNDATKTFPLQIVLPGYYYIGAVYPTNVETGKRIALAFLSQEAPLFKCKTILKLDLANLYRYSAISDSKHLSASLLVGSIIQVTESRPIITDHYTYSWQIRWNVFEQITKPKRLQFEPDSETQQSAEQITVESDELTVEREGYEIPEEDIEENSVVEELDIPEEIEDEQFLDELDQLLYDQQITVGFESDMEELLQLVWDEQREDKPETDFENQGEEF